MANWTDTTITLNGTAENIKKAYEVLTETLKVEDDGQAYINPKNQFPEESKGVLGGYNPMHIMDIEMKSDYFYKSGTMVIIGEGRWVAPTVFVAEHIVKPFGLSGTLVDVDGNEKEYIEYKEGEIITKEVTE